MLFNFRNVKLDNFEVFSNSHVNEFGLNLDQTFGGDFTVREH